ncbi:glycosyltransferase [Rathayibacter sp. CAU 1779]
MSEPERTSLSVCMATYNGARFVTEQLASILAQLPADGEVIVVDDASNDDTVDVIRALADPRLRILEHEANRGYVATFEDAIADASGEVILLSDQDDIWSDDHVAVLHAALENSDVVASNLKLLPDGRSLPSPFGGKNWRLPRQERQHPVRNTLGVLAGAMPYFGCAMGFRADARSLVLPFPEFLSESHDLWIALCGNLARSMAHADEATVLRRLHDANASPSRPRDVRTVLRARWMLVRAIREIRRRQRRALAADRR